MKPTDILCSEHRVIEQVLDCLEKIAAEASARHRIEAPPAEQALEFLSTLADRCHHGKEEQILFASMEARGMPRAVGPLAVMLDEHEHGRSLLRAMRAALATAVGGQPGDVAGFTSAAHGYVELLRDHIAKEDGVLFPLAESVLREEDKARVLEQFARFEAADMGAGTHERMLAIAEQLAERYDVARGSERPAVAAGGCCHGSRGCGH